MSAPRTPEPQLRAPRIGILSSVTAALLAVSPSALASERVTPARLEVDAPPGCTSSATIWAAIARHTDRLREGSGDDAVELHMTLRSTEDRVAGELRVTRRGEPSWRRALTGTTCAEVADALALVAALTFDPGEGADDAPSSTPAGPSRPALTEASVSASAAPPAPAPTSTSAADADVGPAPSAAHAWRFALGGSAGTLAVGTTSAPFAYGGLLEVERDRDGIGPSFRLGVVHAEGSASAGGASVRLAWTTARPSVCPFRLRIGSGVVLRPCAGIEIGAVHASPRGLSAPADTTRAWVAPVLAGRLAWSPLRAFFVEAELALALPLVRDELAADPSLVLYRSPQLVPMTALATGIRFP